MGLVDASLWGKSKTFQDMMVNWIWWNSGPLYLSGVPSATMQFLLKIVVPSKYLPLIWENGGTLCVGVPFPMDSPF